MKVQDEFLPFKIGTTFCGLRCMQSPLDMQIWEYFLRKHGKELYRFVEFGTAWGGFSLFAYSAGGFTYNYDFVSVEKSDATYANEALDFISSEDDLDDIFLTIDLFGEEDKYGQQMLKELLGEKGCTLLFCDNGDKPREVKEYGPSLKKGDWLVVHDFGFEIKGYDIPSYFSQQNLGISSEWWAKSRTRFYRKS